MTIHPGIAAALGVAATLHAAAAADITGTITLKGTPPPEKVITELKSDAQCGPLHPEIPKTRFYVVGAKGGLADVVVALKGLSGKSTGESAAPLVINQRGCEYTPYVSAVQTRQKITVKNSDPVLHNVHAAPAPGTANREENRPMLPQGPDLTFSFPAAEDFLKFKCDVHGWMFCYVSVFDHPYFAVSGKDGTYKIANVPPGKYTLVAKHRKAAPAGLEQEIEVTEAGAKANFEIDLKN